MLWSGERRGVHGGWRERTEWRGGRDSQGGEEWWLLGGGVKEEAARWAATSGSVRTEGEADCFLGSPGSSEAGVSSPDEGDAEAGSKVTADSGVRLLPLVGEFGGDGAEDGFGFLA